MLNLINQITMNTQSQTIKNAKFLACKELKSEANKAMSKVIANTFDQNLRNEAVLKIQRLLAEKIKQIESL